MPALSHYAQWNSYSNYLSPINLQSTWAFCNYLRPQPTILQESENSILFPFKPAPPPRELSPTFSRPTGKHRVSRSHVHAACLLAWCHKLDANSPRGNIYCTKLSPTNSKLSHKPASILSAHHPPDEPRVNLSTRSISRRHHQ